MESSLDLSSCLSCECVVCLVLGFEVLGFANGRVSMENGIEGVECECRVWMLRVDVKLLVWRVDQQSECRGWMRRVEVVGGMEGGCGR